MRLLTLVIVSIIVTAGCTKQTAPSPHTFASRVASVDATYPTAMVTNVFDNPADIAAIEALFPGYETRPKSDTAAAYEAQYIFTFALLNGTAVRVVADGNGELWSTGNGDFRVTGALKATLDRLKAAMRNRVELEAQGFTREQINAMENEVVRITFLKEMLLAATRSGWWGVIILLAFASVYVSAIWHTVRRMPERVLEHVVICIYLIAALNLYNVYFIFVSMGPNCAAACAEFIMLWFNFYITLRLSLLLVVATLLLVLAAIFTRPMKTSLHNPGCFPGAIVALLGTLVLHLFFLGTFFTEIYRNGARWKIEETSRLVRTIQDLRQKLDSQHQRSEGIVTNVQNHQP